MQTLNRSVLQQKFTIFSQAKKGYFVLRGELNIISTTLLDGGVKNAICFKTRQSQI